MACGRARAGTWGVALVTSLGSGCSFESGGTMSGSASADVGETGDPDSSGTTTGTTTDTPTSVDDSVDDTSTASGGQALLRFVEGATLDFAGVDIETMQPRMLTLENHGDATATGILGTTTSGPFGFLGGAWPGNGGDCGPTLDAGASCSLEIAFSPTDFGPSTATLEVDYHDGVGQTEVELQLAGTGVGTSANLLVNGDGENGGTPPPGWDQVLGLYWRTSDMIPPHGGSLSITADAGPNGEFILEQAVDVSQWATLIDAGMITIGFNGWSRAYDPDNDLHWFVVDHEDDAETVLDTFATEAHLITTWTEVTDTRVAPVGTRVVRVHLHCTKTAGGYCDGYFDDMAVTVSHP